MSSSPTLDPNSAGIMSRNATRLCCVAAVAVLSFSTCLLNPWLWDDAIILGLRLAPTGCNGLGELWYQPYWGGFGAKDTFRPFSLSLIYLERLSFGDDVIPYHVLSLLLHATVSLLVMWVFSRLVGRDTGWYCALLFAVHPIHAEAVGMVYGQLELISAFFTLLTIGLYDRATRGGPRPFLFALAICSAFLAACSKESALMLPFLLLLIRSFRVCREASIGGKKAAFLRGLGWDALFWLLPIPYLLLRYNALETLAPAEEATVAFGYSTVTRVKLVVVSAGQAIRLCLIPTGQTLYYGHLRDSLAGRPYGEAFWVVGGLLAAMRIWLGLGAAVTLLGVGWFAITFFPTSNVIPSGVVVAERTLYLPVLGVCLLAAALFDSMRDKKLACLGVLLLTLICGLDGASVVREWRDDVTLWRTTVEAHPRSPLGQLSLGEALIRSWGDRPGSSIPKAELDEAAHAFKDAIELNPMLSEACLGLGMVASRRGDYVAAEAFFKQALARSPGDPKILKALEVCRSRSRDASLPNESQRSDFVEPPP